MTRAAQTILPGTPAAGILLAVADARRLPLAPETPCLLWTGSKDDRGYGRVIVDGKRVKITRIVLAAVLDRPLEPNECALHTCDNPPYFSPLHLFPGTQVDNIADMVAKGRHSVRSGESNGNARLTPADVLAIRAAIDEGEHYADIAARYKISHSNVWAIKTRKTWRHLA